MPVLQECTLQTSGLSKLPKASQFASNLLNLDLRIYDGLSRLPSFGHAALSLQNLLSLKLKIDDASEVIRDKVSLLQVFFCFFKSDVLEKAAGHQPVAHAYENADMCDSGDKNHESHEMFCTVY